MRAIASGVALVPSSSRTGSPGINFTMKKDSTLIPNRTGISWNGR